MCHNNLKKEPTILLPMLNDRRRSVQRGRQASSLSTSVSIKGMIIELQKQVQQQQQTIQDCDDDDD